MTPSTPKPTAILLSGRGSNCQALVEAARRPGFPAAIKLVLSDHAEAAGVAWAKAAGIPTRTIARGDYSSREAHDEGIDAVLKQAGVELVCLAGYMRLLTRPFVEAWEGRMINIHPALLPSFKGLDTHARALEAGVRLHGCTVHFVTFETDSGPIVAQAAVPVLGNDTAETLAARVLKAEHRLYPRALELVASGRASMADGRVQFAGVDDADANASLAAPGAATLSGRAADLESLARLTP